MHLIGITGGIATGKSTVTRRLRELGYEVVDGDEIARHVVRAGSPALRSIVQEFGSSVLLPSGDLDRPSLGNLVFADEGKRKRLNAIVHPAIYREMARQTLWCLWLRRRLVFLDLPLLFETGTVLRFLSRVIVVRCTPEQQLQRLMTRNKLSVAEAEARIHSQLPLEEKCRKADFVVDNSGSIDSTCRQVDVLEAVLCQAYKGWLSRYMLLDALVASAGAALAWLLLATVY